MLAVLIVGLLVFPFAQLWACSCVGPHPPDIAAGMSAAVFTGRVIEMIDLKPLPPPAKPSGVIKGDYAANRRVGNVASDDNLHRPHPFHSRTIRLQVNSVFSGVATGQGSIEIATGMGGGDCGYPFEAGVEYVVYAYKAAEGELGTSICSRTRKLEQAAEDLEYFRKMSNAPSTSSLRVLTRTGSSPGKPGMKISAEGGGNRYSAITNAVGDAFFANLPPAKYTIHADADGDLPDDPTIDLFPKGSGSITLFRYLTITGHVFTKAGTPAAQVRVETLFVPSGEGDMGAITDTEGRYQLRLIRTGQYNLGVNINHTAMKDSPYPHWFHPGTENRSAATVIDFDGRPGNRTLDFTLPDSLKERIVECVIFKSDGHPEPRALVTIFDESGAIIASSPALPHGRVSLTVFAGIPYRLHAVLPGIGPEAASAVPVDIQPRI